MGTEPSSELTYYDYNFTSRTAIVEGNKNRGISFMVKKYVDQLISIPISSDVESLNVSVAFFVQ